MRCVQYDNRLCNYLEDYDKLFIVHADNVGSKQFQEIRRVRTLQQRLNIAREMRWADACESSRFTVNPVTMIMRQGHCILCRKFSCSSTRHAAQRSLALELS